MSNLNSNKRLMEDDYMIDDNDEIQTKRNRIVNKFMDVIDNPNKEISGTKHIKINNINFNVDVGQYNVQILNNMYGENKFMCTCTPRGVYLNFSSNYCKHISYALSELVRLYIKENKNYFKEKKNEIEFRENIELLKNSISNITI